MSFSFSIPSKPKSKSSTLKKSSTTFSDDDRPQTTTKTYVSEFNPSDAPQPLESKYEPIAPLPNIYAPNKKLKNLTSLPLQSNHSDSTLQFEIDTESQNPKTDDSMGYGLNLRARGEKEKLADFELRKLRGDLDNLPDDPGMNEFKDVPVEGFGMALLSGYGWKEGLGIGRNAKADTKVPEVTKRFGRGGLGFTGEVTVENSGVDVGGENIRKQGVGVVKSKEGSKGKKKIGVGKEVRVVRGKEIGTKGKIVDVRSDGEVLVLRISKSDERLKVLLGEVAEVGSEEEDRCLRKLKELRIRENRGGDKYGKERDKNDLKKRAREDEKARTRVNWLRNHIRVRVVSEELKGGRLYLKKGVVVDVVGPGMCDVSMDDNRELVQGVDQDWLETALPRRGGPVLVLSGRHKGVYGSLVDRDSEKEMGVVRDADTHELLNIKLEQIAEYTGDPSDLDY